MPIGQPLVALSVSGGKEAKPQAKVTPPSKQEPQERPQASGFPPPASPTVRKLAQELGIDLNRIRGSEKGGRIIAADLKNYIQQLQQGAKQEKASMPVRVPAELPDFSKWGPIVRKPLSNLRKTIGQKTAERLAFFLLRGSLFSM